jgi:hypothetical protein
LHSKRAPATDGDPGGHRWVAGCRIYSDVLRFSAKKTLATGQNKGRDGNALEAETVKDTILATIAFFTFAFAAVAESIGIFCKFRKSAPQDRRMLLGKELGTCVCIVLVLLLGIAIKTGVFR